MQNIFLMCSRYADKPSSKYIIFLNYSPQVVYFNTTIHQIGLSWLKAAGSKMSNQHDQAFVLEERQVLNDPKLHFREASRKRTIKKKN